jgi:hypothetical protein
VRIQAGTDRIVNHVGAWVLGDLAGRSGLTRGLSEALAPLRQQRRGHDRGQVLTHLAVAIAHGATTLSAIAVLRHPPELLGRVASAPTVWHLLTALTGETLTRIAAARAAARRRVWAAGLDPHCSVIDIDGTRVTVHSDKEGARPTDQHGCGFYPLLATRDETGEPLAIQLRPGNAGSGTATDHIQVLDAALAPRPVDPATETVIVRTDSAGCSHAFLTAWDARGVRFIVGHPLTEELAATRQPFQLVELSCVDGALARLCRPIFRQRRQRDRRRVFRVQEDDRRRSRGSSPPFKRRKQAAKLRAATRGTVMAKPMPAPQSPT